MIVSPPIQLNNNSNEFIISRLRPFCFPIKAPITGKKTQICHISLTGKINTYKHKYKFVLVHSHAHTHTYTGIPSRSRIVSNVSSLAPQIDILLHTMHGTSADCITHIPPLHYIPFKHSISVY